jgi:hypothetical protein
VVFCVKAFLITTAERKRKQENSMSSPAVSSSNSEFSSLSPLSPETIYKIFFSDSNYCSPTSSASLPNKQSFSFQLARNKEKTLENKEREEQHSGRFLRKQNSTENICSLCGSLVLFMDRTWFTSVSFHELVGDKKHCSSEGVHVCCLLCGEIFLRHYDSCLSCPLVKSCLLCKFKQKQHTFACGNYTQLSI